MDSITATYWLEKAVKKVPQLGNSVTTSCAPGTPFVFRRWPNWIIGAKDLAACSLFNFGVMWMAIWDREIAPQPSFDHFKPLSAMMDHISFVSVVLGLEKLTMTTCNATRGEARCVLSRTTPKVPPPPRRFQRGSELVIESNFNVLPPRSAKNRSLFLHALAVLRCPSGVTTLN